MAWTYDPTALNEDNNLNIVRLKLGDINPLDPQFSDEEIEMFLDEAGSVDAAVARAARALAFKYARKADKWVGDLKILASQKSRAYRELAESVGNTSAGIRGVPSAGGIRVSQKEEYEGNNDLVTPSFRRGMFDNVESE